MFQDSRQDIISFVRNFTVRYYRRIGDFERIRDPKSSFAAVKSRKLFVYSTFRVRERNETLRSFPADVDRVLIHFPVERWPRRRVLRVLCQKTLRQTCWFFSSFSYNLDEKDLNLGEKLMDKSAPSRIKRRLTFISLQLGYDVALDHQKLLNGANKIQCLEHMFYHKVDRSEDN